MKKISVMEQPWKPLGLDSWRSDGGYMEGLSEIDAQLTTFDRIGKSHCRKMGAIAMHGNLAHQADRNGQKHLLIPETDERYADARDGTIMPSDMVQLLYEHPELQSAELARLTHVGDWDTNDSIDTPVRQDLLDADALDTTLSNDASYYRIHTLNSENPRELGISRKRVVCQHFGGQVLTVVANNLLVDLSDKTSLDRQFRKDLYEYTRNREDFDASRHTHFLRGYLESQLRNPDPSAKSSGLIPLTTIYYSTHASARKHAEKREQPDEF